MEPPPSEPVASEQQAGNEGSASAAAGATAGALGVPGVSAGIAEKVLGGAGLAELGGVGLAEDDRASLPDSLYGDGVFVRGLWSRKT